MSQKYIIRRRVAVIVAGIVLGVGTAAVVNATERQMPDLTGVNYGQAIDYYSGIMFSEEDGLGNRNIWNESNWKICRQTTPAGVTIRGLHSVKVYVVKNSESCGGNTTKQSTAKSTTKSLSERICDDLDSLSIYQVLNKYTVFLKNKGNGKAMAETLYGHVMLGCEDKLIDESTGIGDFIQSWAPEIFGSN